MRRKVLNALMLIFLSPSLLLAWQGKVVGISDGDTITVMHRGRGERVRLYGVDAPEKRQDFGQKAKQFTSDMVFGKTVDVKPIDTDRYGRTVGIVSADGMNLNVELIRSGHAWLYRSYCKLPQCKEWSCIEAKAKSEKNGLWSIPGPTPPWEFRHRRGAEHGQASAQPPSREESVSKGGSTAILYHGNVESRIFHQPSCTDYNCKNCTAIFKSRENAIKAGFQPCKICKP